MDAPLVVLVRRKHRDAVLDALAQGLDRLVPGQREVLGDKVQRGLGNEHKRNEVGRGDRERRVRMEVRGREHVAERLVDDHIPQLPVATKEGQNQRPQSAYMYPTTPQSPAHGWERGGGAKQTEK